MIRVFLDANVLFSAAYSERSALAVFWRLKTVRLVVSEYVVEEASRNLVKKRPEAISRLVELLRTVEMSSELGNSTSIEINEKDRPVIEAALGSGCDYLVTGNSADFKHLMDKDTLGVRVLMPVDAIEIFGQE